MKDMGYGLQESGRILRYRGWATLLVTDRMTKDQEKGDYMKTIGFAINTKENEKRRAILPKQIRKIRNKSYLYFEQGYGEVLGYSDKEYADEGVHVVSKEEVLKKDIICDPKIGDATYLTELHEGQTIFGYVHAVLNRDIADIIIEKSLTAIAWEDMNRSGRHVFWRNNELAGEAAIMHAFTLYGKLPYECRVAVIGKGNTGRGAYRILASLGAEIVVYGRRTEKLLREEIGNYDVVVNAVLWDSTRKDHLVYAADVRRMKKNSMIVDISCDLAGAIETSIPTTIEDPVYLREGVLHYVVDHTPSLVCQTATKVFGEVMERYLDVLIEDRVEENSTLKKATAIKNGVILDQRINIFQKR